MSSPPSSPPSSPEAGIDERVAAVYRHFWEVIMEGSRARQRAEARRLLPGMFDLITDDSTSQAAGPSTDGLPVPPEEASAADTDELTHRANWLRLSGGRIQRSCYLNFPGSLLFLFNPSLAELHDLRPRPSDPWDMPDDIMDLCRFRVYEDGTGTLARAWADRARRHIDRTCSRMWYPRRAIRNRIKRITDGSEHEITALYVHNFPGTERGKANVGCGPPPGQMQMGRDPLIGVARRWEVLTPQLVTFVKRDAAAMAAAAAAPGRGPGPVETAEIVYLERGAVDKQSSKAFSRALTKSFACERVRAADVGLRWSEDTSQIRRRFLGRFAEAPGAGGALVGGYFGEPARTMLVFAAGVCVVWGGEIRGGMGVVTKDTVHFHSPEEHADIFATNTRLSTELATAPGIGRVEFSPRDVATLGRCTAAFEKPSRGYRPDLQPDGQGGHLSPHACALMGGMMAMNLEERGPPVDPARFGAVETRYAPEWKTVDDARIDREMYEQQQQSGGQGGGDDAVDNTTPTTTAITTHADINTPDTGNDYYGTPPNTPTPSFASLATSPPPAPPLPPRARPTRNRASLRALLAALQLSPFDLSDCTRLVVASDNETVLRIATVHLRGMLERGLPLRTAAGTPVADADLWWAFAGAVKDLAYRGVEVALMRCREGEGVVLDVTVPAPAGGGGGAGGGGKQRWVYGMAQALGMARAAARRDVDVAPEMMQSIAVFL